MSANRDEPNWRYTHPHPNAQNSSIPPADVSVKETHWTTHCKVDQDWAPSFGRIAGVKDALLARTTTDGIASAMSERRSSPSRSRFWGTGRRVDLPSAVEHPEAEVL